MRRLTPSPLQKGEGSRSATHGMTVINVEAASCRFLKSLEGSSTLVPRSSLFGRVFAIPSPCIPRYLSHNMGYGVRSVLFNVLASPLKHHSPGNQGRGRFFILLVYPTKRDLSNRDCRTRESRVKCHRSQDVLPHQFQLRMRLPPKNLPLHKTPDIVGMKRLT